jgi:uncharacterized protein (TIGR00369 family)
MESEPVRRRIIEWEDPRDTARVSPDATGLEHLQAMIDGEVPPPPMASLMGMNLIAVTEGSATFTCTPDEFHYNTVGTVHGGLVCTLLDSAAGCAAQSVMPAGHLYTSIELKVSYLRPLRHDSGEITCVGTVLKSGRRVVFTEATVTDASGALIATATSSLLVIPTS